MQNNKHAKECEWFDTIVTILILFLFLFSMWQKPFIKGIGVLQKVGSLWLLPNFLWIVPKASGKHTKNNSRQSRYGGCKNGHAGDGGGVRRTILAPVCQN